MAEDDRSEEERWIDRLLNPLEGPVSENAYPEDPVNDPDGSFKLMNDSARAYNRRMGLVDEAAHIPWTPENAKSPEGCELRFTEEQMARSRALQAEWDKRFERFEQSKLKSASQLPDLDRGGPGDHLGLRGGRRRGGRLDRAEPRRPGHLARGRNEAGDAALRGGPLDPPGEVRPEAGFPEPDPRRRAAAREAPATPPGPSPPISTWSSGGNANRSVRGGPSTIRMTKLRRRSPSGGGSNLLAAIGEMGSIDCSCGWAGDATDGRTVDRESQLELLCPECRRPLFSLVPEE